MFYNQTRLNRIKEQFEDICEIKQNGSVRVRQDEVATVVGEPTFYRGKIVKANKAFVLYEDSERATGRIIDNYLLTQPERHLVIFENHVIQLQYNGKTKGLTILKTL